MVSENVVARPSTSPSMKCNVFLFLVWMFTGPQEQEGNQLTLLQRDSMQANELVRPTHAHFAEQKTPSFPPPGRRLGSILLWASDDGERGRREHEIENS